MDGRVLERAFKKDFRREHPIRYVATYEDAAPAARVAAVGEDFDAEELAATEEALRAIGYLGGSSGGEGPAIESATGETAVAEAGGESSS